MKHKLFVCMLIAGVVALLAASPITTAQIRTQKTTQSLEGYRVETLPKAMTPLSGGSTVVFGANSYESVSDTIDLPFDFVYLGHTFKQIRVCSAGFVTFNVNDYSAYDYFTANDLGAVDPKNALAAFWDNLYMVDNSKVHYKTIGSAPNRSFVVEFLNMDWSIVDISLLNFQIQLDEGSNDIEFHYGTMDGLSATDEYIVDGASIGIKDDQGRFINALDGSRDAAQNAIKTPPVNNFRFTTSPVPANDIGAVELAGLPHTIRVGDSIAVSLTVRNYGTADQSDYSIYYKANGESPVAESPKTPLPAGSVKTLAFTTPWVPKAKGPNHLTAWTSLKNEENARNDTLAAPVEIDVKDSSVIFVEDFESYPLGALPDAAGSPWVQLEQGRNANVSGTWVHSGKRNFEINSFMFNIENDYVKFDLKRKPSELDVELWYTPDGYYVYTDFAEVGLSYVTSKFHMAAKAGYYGSDHNLYFRSVEMDSAVLAFDELEYARGPASMGIGNPKHNYIRSEYDFTNNEVRFFIGSSSDAPLRSTIHFDGGMDFNAMYIAGGLNETYIDDITITAKGEYAANTHVNQEAALLPSSCYLSQNYPNPFNPRTTIQFGLSNAGHATLEVLNGLGQRISVLVDGFLPAGRHTVDWNGESHSSGLYFYRLRTGSFESTKKMLMLK